MRLIDADTLAEQICEKCGVTFETGCETCNGSCAIIDIIESMATDDKIKFIADHYGFTSQADMLIEEAAEFAVTRNKLRRGSGDVDHLKEELADVLVIANQLKYLLGVEDVDKVVNAKIDRQINRINREKNDEKANCINTSKGTL